MSAMFPMCVRASRSLLRFQSGTSAASSPQQLLDIIRTLSTEKNPAGTGGATGGLAQAILQERLQQSQVRGAHFALQAVAAAETALFTAISARLSCSCDNIQSHS